MLDKALHHANDRRGRAGASGARPDRAAGLPAREHRRVLAFDALLPPAGRSDPRAPPVTPVLAEQGEDESVRAALRAELARQEPGCWRSRILPRESELPSAAFDLSLGRPAGTPPEVDAEFEKLVPLDDGWRASSNPMRSCSSAGGEYARARQVVERWLPLPVGRPCRTERARDPGSTAPDGGTPRSLAELEPLADSQHYA